MAYLKAPSHAVRLKYRCRYIEPGEVIDVEEIDAEALLREGWSSTVSFEKAKRPTKKIKAMKEEDDDGISG